MKLTFNICLLLISIDYVSANCWEMTTQQNDKELSQALQGNVLEEMYLNKTGEQCLSEIVSKNYFETAKVII